MQKTLKALGVVLLVVVALVVVAGLALLRPDISYARLQQKYGVPSDNYMQMPDGVLVHYRDEGPRDGRTLVLVHGFSASLIDWDAWAAPLSKRYRVIQLDLPGHGMTRAPAGYQASTDGYADLIDALAARLRPTRFVLIGNSMGGGVAWNFAVRHPGWLSGLVLVDAGGWPHQAGERGQKGGPIIFRLLGNPVARAVLSHIDIKPLIGQGLKSAFLNPDLVTPAVIDRYADFARAPGHRAILLSIQNRSPGRNPIADLAGIQTPTLVMHGQQDRLIPFADGQGFARTIPGAVLIAYPNVGHVPMEQVPERSANDLDRWLRAKVWPAPAGAIDPGPVAGAK
jgi:pimeloyl-ACP methyl ester carboxylesterase